MRANVPALLRHESPNLFGSFIVNANRESGLSIIRRVRWKPGVSCCSPRLGSCWRALPFYDPSFSARILALIHGLLTQWSIAQLLTCLLIVRIPMIVSSHCGRFLTKPLPPPDFSYKSSTQKVKQSLCEEGKTCRSLWLVFVGTFVPMMHAWFRWFIKNQFDQWEAQPRRISYLTSYTFQIWGL